MILLDPHLRHLDILVRFKAGMFQDLFGAGHRTAIDPYDHLRGFGGLDHAAYVSADACQAVHFPDFVLGQFQSRQVGDLSHVGTSGAGKDQDFIWFTKTFLLHFPSSLLDPFLDFFHFGDLPRDLDDSIHNQGGSDHDTIAADLFDVLNFNHFRVRTGFFDRFFGSLRELIALGSTHSQNFDLFHLCLLF
jgi:hypothetical protein